MSITSVLAQQLKDGLISLPTWEAAMRAYLRSEYTTAMILTRGGREFVTQSDWGYVGSQLKDQYAYLSGFSSDIQKDPAKWLTGRLDNRVRLYEQSGYAALEDFERRDRLRTGWTEERRVLGVADHCKTSKSGQLGCVELAARGWQRTGSLPKIGAAPCSNNCKCNFEYRRSAFGGGWEYSDG